MNLITNLVIVVMNQLSGKAEKKGNQQTDLDYCTQLESINEEQRELIHNINHCMALIRKFALDQDYDSILEITEEWSDLIEDSHIKFFTNNHILNSILTEKYTEAVNEGIEANFYVEPGVNLDKISPIHLVFMLGNLLDNAIYAASRCVDAKRIKLYIYKQDAESFCVIKISNNYSGSIKYKHGKFISTKKEKGVHGIGLQSVNKLAQKYGGSLRCRTEGNQFYALLFLSVC